MQRSPRKRMIVISLSGKLRKGASFWLVALFVASLVIRAFDFRTTPIIGRPWSAGFAMARPVGAFMSDIDIRPGFSVRIATDVDAVRERIVDFSEVNIEWANVGEGIDDLEEDAEEGKPDEARKDEIKSRKNSIIATRLPEFWQELIEQMMPRARN